MISKGDLLAYLHQIDSLLDRKITLVAVGGTARTLYGLKESTKDVDFCALSKDDQDLIRSISEKTSKAFRLDLFREGHSFILQLPEDYAAKSRPIKESFKNLIVKLLSPIDIILTKTSRLNERDLEDIRALVSKKRIDKKRLIKRYEMVKETYAASNMAFHERFEQVIKEFFK